MIISFAVVALVLTIAASIMVFMVHIRRWLTEPTLSDKEAARRFAKRHSLGLWLAVVPGIGFFIAGFLPTKLTASGVPAWIVVGVLCFVPLFFYVTVIFRCPKCGAHPTSSTPGTTGLLILPKRCAKCKAPLLPEHRWGQD
ncbi:hypothetical protein [Variovorax soli]|uniref:hypothetical protein n=1 Tax=Variovorax soli TaxID=376815 RepID=UPI00129487BB|nr:hypothetical protein [Variovorax soli]